MSSVVPSADPSAPPASTLPAAAPLPAPKSWGRIALISDLHLGAQAPRTTQTFLDWLNGPARDAHALFILGDLFEAWIGDDLLTPQAKSVAPDAAIAQTLCAALHAFTDTGRALFVQHGNRDFLLGAGFAQAAGAQLLSDPALLLFQGERIVLTHGDPLCLGDTAYLQFRAQVRHPDWQRRVLAQPLAARVQQAQAMRAASSAAQTRPENWADAEPNEAHRWLANAGSRWMIHGHTHRPCDRWENGLLRQVLSDWDCDATHGAQRRAEALWLIASGKAIQVSRQTCV